MYVIILCNESDACSIPRVYRYKTKESAERVLNKTLNIFPAEDVKKISENVYTFKYDKCIFSIGIGEEREGF